MKTIEDQEFIIEQIKNLPPLARQKSLELYAFEWGRAYGMNLLDHQREGVARRLANDRMRAFVESYTKSINGIVIPPPTI